MSKKHLTDQRFSDFNLADSLQQGIAEAGFEFCTPIQAAALPATLDGRDLAGQAQTGTGKTVAFLLACCHYLLNHPAAAARHRQQPRALILAPTRELAIQIYEDARILTQYTGLSLGLVYGGTGYESQKQMLQQGADILIGTPGRLIDFANQGLFNLKQVQVAVLDEADRMFDLGFIKDIRYLLRQMPPAASRLNLLFSATLSYRVMEMAYEHMNDPQQVNIEPDTRIAQQIQEWCYYPANPEKLPLLVNLLACSSAQRALVFVNTRLAAEDVSQTLTTNNLSNAALSGNVLQSRREQLLAQFKEGKIRVLVATDVAARGLHIPAVDQVYNYDLPQDAEDYVHRIGRTARAGASGEAISFVCEQYAYSMLDIETYIGHAITQKPITPEYLSPIILPHPARQHSNQKPKPSPKPSPKPNQKPRRQPAKSSAPDPATIKRQPQPIKPSTSNGELPGELPGVLPGVLPRRLPGGLSGELPGGLSSELPGGLLSELPGGLSRKSRSESPHIPNIEAVTSNNPSPHSPSPHNRPRNAVTPPSAHHSRKRATPRFTPSSVELPEIPLVG